MNLVRYAVCLAAIIWITAPTPPDAQERRFKFEIGRWKGESISTNGRFRYCAIAADSTGLLPLNQLATFFIITSENQFDVAIAKPGATFAKGDGWTQAYQIDDAPPKHGRARPATSELLTLRLDRSDLDALGMARMLKIVAKEHVMTFRLEGLGPALDWLQNCADDGIAGRPTRRP